MNFFFRKERITGLHSQLFDIRKTRIENYSCVSAYSKPFGEKYLQKMERSMWRNIQDNLSIAAKQHGMEMGSIVTCEGQEAVVVCLNHISDNSRKIRDKLTNILFHWNCSTTVKLFSKKGDALQQEVEQMRSWLSKEYTHDIRIIRKPEEAIFRMEVPDSGFHRLAEDVSESCKIENITTAQPVTVVFIGDVDTAIVNYKLYCQKQLKEYMREVTMELHDFVCILSMNPESGIKAIKDFVPGNQNMIDVYSAWDPEVKPISCVIVKLKKAVKSGT